MKGARASSSRSQDSYIIVLLRSPHTRDNHKERVNPSLNHGATFIYIKDRDKEGSWGGKRTWANMKHGCHDRIIFSDVENLEAFGATSLEPDDTIMKQEWRRYGAARRKELIEKDEHEGGTRFELHKKCHIEQYFSIADRVLRDFRAKCEDPGAGLEEVYIMGYRLLAFIGQALPQHPEFGKSSAAAFRAQATLDLEWIQDKMLDIALKIDEEQLNKYITMDFDPQPDDDSTISSAEANFSNFADFSTANGEGWEDFTDWAFQPSAVETDASSSMNTSGDESAPGARSSGSEQFELIDDPQIIFDLEEVESSSETEEEPEKVEVQPLPQAFVQFRDADDETDNDSQSEDYGYNLNDAPTASSFLKRIAKEDFRYESDSEAVDSWAPDGETISRASSGTYTTYDPARIAFREIMNSIPKMSLTPPPPPNSPSEVENRKDLAKGVNGVPSDGWAAFDFASVRQQPSVSS
eukprot:scaffold1619_cov161-Amphora_coffeaeformis.AAC.6